MESSRNRLENRYTISLPWKRDKALLPNNYPLAERRLFSMESNLLKDKSKAKMYDEAITEYRKKNGCAWALSEREVQAIASLVYYLPHNGIYRPEKKETYSTEKGIWSSVPVPRCFLQLTPTQRSMPHWKSAWGRTSLFVRASCLRGRYFEHVLINLPTIGRHSHPLVPLEESRLNNATNEPRHPESHPRRQAFSRNGKLCNAVNHERQRSRQYKCGEDS